MISAKFRPITYAWEMVAHISLSDFDPPNRAPNAECVLCDSPGGRLVWANTRWRVVAVDDPSFPGFYRVIAQDHIAEFSALTGNDRHHLMDVVATVEQVLISLLKPTKMNLASIGNMVPHLHWHVVPRFASDSHFPESIWGPPQRESPWVTPGELTTPIEELEFALSQALSRSDG